MDDRHLVGVFIRCDKCDADVVGIWHKPELISKDGALCIKCFHEENGRLMDHVYYPTSPAMAT